MELELEKLRGIVSTILGLPSEMVTETADFTEDLGADSLEVFRIVTAAEEAFEAEFSEPAGDSLHCIRDIAQSLQDLQQSGSVTEDRIRGGRRS